MPKVIFDQEDVRKAVDAGLKKVNLIELANDDVLRLDRLDEFMSAALAALSGRVKK
ncbi:hypothetical protein FHT87_005229 [Rhizobium sp. BK316]|uniref:hypothetical protein n=1 Tax=Rhizobium sp. BK316 TaxID=2587053 RepID=UPI00161E87DF|nr:hypothetical protein [Rhizobium sp. BK316]MBB3411276.1 hypothetical protein [Rhizobium sp. BK316]